jgi:hypothetical protein
MGSSAKEKMLAFLAPLGKDGFSELLTLITTKVVDALQKSPKFAEWLGKVLLKLVFGVENHAEIPIVMDGMVDAAVKRRADQAYVQTPHDFKRELISALADPGVRAALDTIEREEKAATTTGTKSNIAERTAEILGELAGSPITSSMIANSVVEEVYNAGFLVNLRGEARKNRLREWIEEELAAMEKAIRRWTKTSVKDIEFPAWSRKFRFFDGLQPSFTDSIGIALESFKEFEGKLLAKPREEKEKK